MTLVPHPLTPDRWDDLETLFSEASATRGCWCMWWRVAAGRFGEMTKDDRRAAFRDVVCEGPAPGLIAYDGDRPVGWVQITPRAAIPRFNAGRASKPAEGADTAATWAVSCFYIARSHRGQGVMTALARAACDHAARQGAASVEAAALDPRRPLQWSEGFVGLRRALEKAGFQPVEQRTDLRVLMRWRPSGGTTTK